MDKQAMVMIEIFATPHCKRCQSAKDLVKQVASEWTNNEVQWREVNVIDEIDYTVQLGIVATPAIAIDGKSVFTSLPSANKLKTAISVSIQQRNK